MDFFFTTLFLALYYVRPQEWIGFLEGTRLVFYTMIAAFVGLVTRGAEGLPKGGILKTPHDWLMLGFFLVLILPSGSIYWTFREVLNLIFFYFVTVSVLHSLRRIYVFLTVWCIVMFWVALMGFLQPYGLDFTGGKGYTEGQFIGRLVLGTSLFSNPNALGHSIYPAILLLYYLMFWQRTFVLKFWSIPLFWVPIRAVYMTASKGAYVSGFATTLAGYVFGRARSVQVIVIVLALAFGWPLLKTLPRMSELDDARSDEAINFRLKASEFGLESMNTLRWGLGYREFARSFGEQVEFQDEFSAHSSYVALGAELGKFGFGCWLGVVYCCLRTLLTCKTVSNEEERVRRILFTLICGYMISSWMVDFSYRANFFLNAAVTAAFHRYLARRDGEQVKQDEADLEGARPVFGAGPLPDVRVGPKIGVPEFLLPGARKPIGPFDRPEENEPPKEKEEEVPNAGITWNRLELVDIVLMVLFYFATVRFWRYVLENL